MDQQLDIDPNDMAQQETAANDFEPQLEVSRLFPDETILHAYLLSTRSSI